MYGGGVAALALLAFSLIAASCSNDSDSDGGSPSPTLPATVGDNPIKAETKLGSFHTGNSSTGKEIYISNDIFLVMKTNGTAEYHDYGDLEYVFKYTWDATKQEIYMVVEKTPYDDGTLLNYNQLLSKLTIDEFRESEKRHYEERKKEDEYFEEDYPGCDTYEKYLDFLIKKSNCNDINELFELSKEESLKYLNTIFGAKLTYGYDFDEDGKMVLTEKFTGMKNLLFYSSFKYDAGGTRVYIDIDKEDVEIYLNGVQWYGEFSTGNNIVFEKEDSEEKKTGSYSEDIANETVTVTFDGKKYPCEFRGTNFIEVDD